MARILGAVRDAVVASNEGYRGGVPTLRLASALAEGADRIAAAAALDDLPEVGHPRYRLDLVLPFAETAYRATFDHPEELPEFDRLSALADRTLVLDGIPGRFDAFVAGGRAIVDHCDLLIAVWDLQGAAGAGGTANQVGYAVREEVPVVVVHPARPDAPWLYDPARPDEGVSAGLALLPQVVRDLVAVPPRGGQERFFRERHRRGFLGKAFRVAVDANQRGTLPVLGWPVAAWRMVRAILRPDFTEPYAEAARAEWLERWTNPPFLPPAVSNRMADAFAAPFGWADRLATYYGNRHRSGFAVVFGLSWIVVLLALSGVLLHGSQGWPVLLAVMELGLLLVILAVVVRGRLGRFHERWLDYRALAERLRHLTFLWPIGRTGTLARQPRHVWDGDPRSDWTVWLVRAAVRNAGMPTGTFDPAYLEGCRGFLKYHELEVQARYHETTAARLGALQHRLHPQVELAFGGALVAAALHLAELLPWGRFGMADWHYPVWFAALLTFAVIVLPAYGAARHGFLGQSDVLGSSVRSAALALRLRDLQWRLDRLGMTEELTSLPSGELMLEAARLMEADLASWRTVFRGKPLTPA